MMVCMWSVLHIKIKKSCLSLVDVVVVTKTNLQTVSGSDTVTRGDIRWITPVLSHQNYFQISAENILISVRVVTSQRCECDSEVLQVIHISWNATANIIYQHQT